MRRKSAVQTEPSKLRKIMIWLLYPVALLARLEGWCADLLEDTKNYWNGE